MSEWLSSGTTSSEESAHPTKLGVGTEGPSTTERVHVNCNLTTFLRKGITERINIRRDLSYCWPFHIPLWRQLLAWIVFEVFTFYLWSFFSTSHSSEFWVEFFWIQFLFVHLWQSESCHGGEECRAHGNNLYGYRGRVQIYGIKDTYIQSAYIQITFIVFGDHQNTYIQIHF